MIVPLKYLRFKKLWIAVILFIVVISVLVICGYDIKTSILGQFAADAIAFGKARVVDNLDDRSMNHDTQVTPTADGSGLDSSSGVEKRPVLRWICRNQHSMMSIIYVDGDIAVLKSEYFLHTIDVGTG